MVDYTAGSVGSIPYEILKMYQVRVTETIDFEQEVRQRIDFLKAYVLESNKCTLVLGISGGVDSTTAGKLCQLACKELRKEGYQAEFIAVRLPHGVQADEADAGRSLDFINPDRVVVVDIYDAVTEIHDQVSYLNSSWEARDFHKGNVKARMRMLAQYEIAGLTDGLVVGTDHMSELVPAFYTKWGDQACDITPLSGLNKRQVRKLAEELGAPESMYKKVPTADLEDHAVGKPDEDALGFTYDQLDDFLEGKFVDQSVVDKIVEKYDSTRHKRNWPVAFGG